MTTPPARGPVRGETGTWKERRDESPQGRLGSKEERVYVYAKLPADPKGPPKHLSVLSSDLLPDLAPDDLDDPLRRRRKAHLAGLMASRVRPSSGAQHRVKIRFRDCELVDNRHLRSRCPRFLVPDLHPGQTLGRGIE